MTTRTLRNKPIRRLFVLVFVVLVVGVAYWQIQGWIRAGEIAGTYLAKGGRSLVVLERGWFPKLKMVEGYFPTAPADVGQAPRRIERSAFFDSSDLYLTQIERYEGTAPRKEKGRVYLRVGLSPSEIDDGDWDLASGEYRLHDSSFFRPAMAPPGNPKGWANLHAIFNRVKAVLEGLARRYKPELLEPDIHMAIPPAFSPIPSFLHRIADDRLVHYFRQRAMGRFSPDDLDEFRMISADHSDDSHLLVHAIDVEAQYGDLERARVLLAKWKSEHEAEADELLREAAEIAEKSVAKAEGLPAGENLKDLMEIFWNADSNLEQRVTAIKEFLTYDRLVGTTRPLVDPSPERLSPTATLPNYLDLQINARVMRTIAQLLLFQGHPRESIELLAGLYQQGNMLSADGILIQRLIGIAIRLIANWGLDLVFLNACDTEEDFDYALAVLDRIAKSATPETYTSLLSDEWGVPRIYMERSGGKGSINFLDAWIRYRVANTRFATTRMAVAATRHYIEHGRYPGSSDGYLPYLPDGVPQDMFGKPPEPLRFTEGDSDPYLVYSVGPDDRDDRGLTQYSPTNGTKSVGDLVVEVTKNRKYPFPANGTKGLSAHEVLDLFPEGLPWSAFTGNGSDPLNVMDATPGGSATVFCVGPSGTVGASVVNVEMLEIPGMIPMAGHDRTTPVNTGSTKRNVQYVFHPEADPENIALKEERQRRWEALTDEEREAITWHRQSALSGMSMGMGMGMYGGEPSFDKQVMETTQRLREEGRLDPSLYPSSARTGPLRLVPYDPTNGVKSGGQIFLEGRD